MTNGKATCLEFEKNITSPNHEYIFSSTRNEGKSCSGILRGDVESTKPEGLVKSTQTAYFTYREFFKGGGVLTQRLIIIHISDK